MATIRPRSEIPLAGSGWKVASDRHFQPSTDRIQNHRFSLTDHARGKAAANIGCAASFVLQNSNGFLIGPYRREAATPLAVPLQGRPVQQVGKQSSKKFQPQMHTDARRWIRSSSRACMAERMATWRAAPRRRPRFHPCASVCICG